MYISSMFTMNPMWHTGHQRRKLGFQCGKIPGMHDIRFQAAKQTPESHIEPQIFSGTLLQDVHLDIRVLDSVTEISACMQTNNYVTVFICRQTIDYVDEAIFQAANCKLMNDMGNEWRRP